MLNLLLKAGNHPRVQCPVSFRIKRSSIEELAGAPEQIRMKDSAGNPVPVQCLENGGDLELHWMVANLPAGESQTYTVYAAASADSTSSTAPSASATDGIRFIEKPNQLDVEVGGQYFTSFVHDPALAKPYIGPVIGPYGDSYTRLDFDIKEHPHHRSVWLGIGDVNGIDTWNEPKDRHGKQLFGGIEEKIDGSVLARFTSNHSWTSFEGKPQVEEQRTVTFYNTPVDGRFVDMEITFTATKGQVEFGATKEAGPLGIRVAESMKVANGGTMVNSYGSIGEKECWGQRAQWCDYFGNVGRHTLGIALFDHPDNVDHPSYWHIRDYGLLAANNFYFLGGKLFKKGQSMHFKYRMYFHDGDVTQAKVGDRYQDYINPPKIELVS
jgi:hypothetical protein